MKPDWVLRRFWLQSNAVSHWLGWNLESGMYSNWATINRKSISYRYPIHWTVTRTGLHQGARCPLCLFSATLEQLIRRVPNGVPWPCLCKKRHCAYLISLVGRRHTCLRHIWYGNTFHIDSPLWTEFSTQIKPSHSVFFIVSLKRLWKKQWIYTYIVRRCNRRFDLCCFIYIHQTNLYEFHLSQRIIIRIRALYFEYCWWYKHMTVWPKFKIRLRPCLRVFCHVIQNGRRNVKNLAAFLVKYRFTHGFTRIIHQLWITIRHTCVNKLPIFPDPELGSFLPNTPRLISLPSETVCTRTRAVPHVYLLSRSSDPSPVSRVVFNLSVCTASSTKLIG